MIGGGLDKPHELRPYGYRRSGGGKIGCGEGARASQPSKSPTVRFFGNPSVVFRGQLPGSVSVPSPGGPVVRSRGDAIFLSGGPPIESLAI